MKGKEDDKDQEEQEDEDGFEMWKEDKRGSAEDNDGEEKLREWCGSGILGG